jgi:hypothetical protein
MNVSTSTRYHTVSSCNLYNTDLGIDSEVEGILE